MFCRISPEDSIEDCIAEKQLLQSIMDNSDADKLITLSALRKFTDRYIHEVTVVLKCTQTNAIHFIISQRT